MLVEVKPCTDPIPDYSQLTAQIKMTLLNTEFRRLHHPVMCRDYLTDAFWSETIKKPTEIYGFKWKPNTMPLTQKHYFIELQFTNTKHAHAAPNILALIIAWERILKITPKTKLIKTIDPMKTVFRVSPKWVDRPIALSLLTMSMRIGWTYTNTKITPLDHFSNFSANNEVAPGDATKVKRAIPNVTKIFNNKAFPAQTYAQFENIHETHNISGICNFERNSFENV